MATKVFIVLSLFYCVWAQIAARQADEFVKSSCINTHFDYPAYKPHLDTLYQFLTKSGIRSVRDAPSDNKVSDLGISTAWTIEVNNGMTTSSLQTKVNTLNSRVKAGFKVVAVLGPNEPNNIWIKDSVTYNGQGAPDESKNSVGGVVAFQTDLYNMVKASSDMKNIPVWGPPWSSGQWVPNVTFVGNFDYGDFHPYPAGNCHSIYYSYAGIDNYYCVTNSPATQLTKGYSTNNFLLTEYEYYFGGKTLMASETGYHTSNGDNNVPIDVHTIYMPRVWLENFRIGFPISCSYELYDQGTDLSDKEQNFGVIFNNLTAKPAFNIMSFMFNFLSDKGADFTPDSVTASILVTPVGGFTRTELVRILLFQKRSKTDFYIIIWHEVAHYNVWTGATVNIPDMPTTVTLSKGMSSATLHTFDLRGAVTNSTISLSANGTKFSVTATPMMKIIHLTSSTSSPPTPSPPSTSNKIVSNGILAQNDRLWDPTNRYFLTLQDDGNLVVYRLNNATSTTPIWASNSINASADSYTLYIQSDGNVVVNAQFGSQSRPLWDTKTAGKGTGPYTLSIDSSGILTLSDSKETLLWSSSTLSAGTTLTTATTSAAGTTSTSGKTPSLTSSTSTSGNTTKSQVDQSVSGNERIYIPFMCLLFAIALL